MNQFTRMLLAAMAALALAGAAPAQTSDTSTATSAQAHAETIDPYVARFGRARPVVAVIGENSGAVLSDYVIPYGVLAQSGVADVSSVATQAGPLRLAPLRINPEHTIATFDRQFPDGADYVIVPAMHKRDDPALLAWISTQAAKGATMVSICNGSLVLAKAGLTAGHRATGHWSTWDERRSSYPDTQWLKNTRYVADGKLVTSAGITAAIPVSLALVEAIGGKDRATAFAREIGVDSWGPEHNSDAFRLNFGDGLAAVTSTVFRSKQDVGLPLAAGMDEIKLSLTAEAYDASFLSHVLAVADSDAPVRTLSGLMVFPDRVAGQGKALDLMLPSPDATPSGRFPDKLVGEIKARYGAAAARFVMLEWEYPWPPH